MNAFRSLIVVVLFIFLSMPNSSIAYEPENHIKVSTKAIDLINHCAKSTGAPIGISEEEAELIFDANAAEDTGIVNAIVRVVNWHFFNPEKEARQGYGPIDRSMTDLVMTRERSITRAAIFDAKLAGAALHFIEDASVPAHVIPVFHGPVPPLVFYGPTGLLAPRMIHDSIDTSLGNTCSLEDRLQALLLEPGWCEALLDGNLVASMSNESAYPLDKHPAMYFVNAIAKKTLAATREKIPGCNQKWETFWNHDYGNDYFLGYPHEWGGTKTWAFGGEEALVNGCSLSDDKYDDFVNDRHMQAAIYGASFLVHYKRLFPMPN